MTKTSKQKKTPPKKISLDDLKLSDFRANKRKEIRLELPLLVDVEGKLPEGKKFKEKTTIQNISSGGAYFSLDSGVIIGSKLNLIIEIPKKLGGKEKLKLKLGGLTIRLEEANKEGKKQGVALRFHKSYKILSDKKEKK
jgi:hypothetical protein